MATPNTAGAVDGRSRRVTPADVDAVRFGRSGLGKRGYDEAEVDLFLDRVRGELAWMTAEKAELRDETRRLKSRIQELGAAEGEQAARRDEPSAQAVRILSVAQQTADQYVAEAEQYSRRITSDGRERYEELVLEARERARAILEDAERMTGRASDALGVDAAALNGSGPSKQDLEKQVAYLRAFGEVCRVQLRSYLESLLRAIEDEWGHADPRAIAASVDGARALVPGEHGTVVPGQSAHDGPLADPGLDPGFDPGFDVAGSERGR